MASLRVAAAGVAACAVALAALLVPGMHSHATPVAASGQPTLRTLAAQPLAFEPNAGRFQGAGDFLVSDHGATLAIRATGSTLAVTRHAALRTRLVGATDSRPRAGRRLAEKVNWYAGTDSSRWRTGLPTFGSVGYADVYPGVDVRYRGHRGRLEYDFLLKPRASARPIALDLAGANAMSVAVNGDLLVRIGGRTVRQLRPVAYQ